MPFVQGRGRHDLKGSQAEKIGETELHQQAEAGLENKSNESTYSERPERFTVNTRSRKPLNTGPGVKASAKHWIRS